MRIDATWLYNATPSYFKNNQLCAGNNPNVTQINTNALSCSVSVGLLDKGIPLIGFGPLKKTLCVLAKKLTANVVCSHSSCTFLVACCEDNLCNTPENLKLMLLAIYSNPGNKKLRNDYSAYTDRKCTVNLKNKLELDHHAIIQSQYNLI